MNPQSKIIIVNSHRRSGTHLMIDTLLQNIEEARFPRYGQLPADFNLGSLLRKDDRIYKIFEKELSKQGVLIVKNHNLLVESEIQEPSDKHEVLLRKVLDRAQHIYVQRNPTAVLASLYNYCGRKTPPSDFIRQKNDHYCLKSDQAKDYHNTRPRYLGFHVSDWQRRPDVCHFKYENLVTSFEDEAERLFEFIGVKLKNKPSRAQLPTSQKRHVLMKAVSKYLSINIKSTSVQPGKGQVHGGKELFNDVDIEFIQREYALELNSL